MVMSTWSTQKPVLMGVWDHYQTVSRFLPTSCQSEVKLKEFGRSGALIWCNIPGSAGTGFLGLTAAPWTFQTNFTSICVFSEVCFGVVEAAGTKTVLVTPPAPPGRSQTCSHARCPEVPPPLPDRCAWNISRRRHGGENPNQILETPQLVPFDAEEQQSSTWRVKLFTLLLWLSTTTIFITKNKKKTLIFVSSDSKTSEDVWFVHVGRRRFQMRASSKSFFLRGVLVPFPQTKYSTSTSIWVLAYCWYWVLTELEPKHDSRTLKTQCYLEQGVSLSLQAYIPSDWIRSGTQQDIYCWNILK